MATSDSPKDDPLIEDSQVLLRRINPEWKKEDGSLSSAAFQNLEGDAFSVAIASFLDNPTDYNAILDKFPRYGLASFSAGDVRSLNQGVTHEPTAEEPAHGHVNGTKTKGVKKQLARLAKFIVVPQ